jgi:hypothetical protein
MAEEQIVDQKPVETEVVPGNTEGAVAAPEAPVIDEVEAKAREQGWVPKDEWQGDPAAWRPANVFVDRGELLGKIKSQSGKMRELEGMVNYLAEQNRKLYEAGYQKAVDELQAARDAAVEAGDSKAVRELDQKIRAHEKELEKAQQPAPKASSATAAADELYQEWATRNPWYEKDEVLQNWANGAAVKLKTKNPNAQDVDIYKHLETEVRKVFPDKFKRVGAPSPDGASNRGAGSPARKDGNSEFDALLGELPEEEAQIARNLVKRGHVTKEQFMQDFKLVNGRR